MLSIKPCTTSPQGGGGGKPTPGRLHLECVTLDNLVHDVYLTFPEGKPINAGNGLLALPVTYWQWRQQIKGSTGWINSDRFTIDGKADGPVSDAMMRGPMMQKVLKERFHLLIHREPRQVAVYELAAAKGGAKIQPTKEGSCVVLDKPQAPRKPGEDAPPPICGGSRVSPKGGVDTHGVTMAFLCMRLSMAMERDVIDKTGLAGTYDVHLDLALNELMPAHQAPPAASNNPLPDAGEPTGNIPNALRKIGLQIQSAKSTEDFLVIDHAEKPSAN